MTDKKNTEFIDDIANEAAEWFLKLQANDLSETEYLKWQKWHMENDANKQAFSKAEDCWNALDNITDVTLESLKAEQNIIPLSSAKSGRRRFMPHNIKRHIKLAGSIAAALVIALSIGLSYQDFIAVSPDATTYQTARAEHKVINLDDGSKISLGARSIVNVDYSPMARRITLVRGEAVFDVSKDKTRPFIVKTGNGTVTAIGTKFNIRANDKNIIVTVLEGVVEVNPYLANDNIDRAPLPRVGAGKAVSYRSDGFISEVVKSNVEAAVSWERGLLIRVNTPLANVIEDVNRYSSREIIIGDPALNDIRFTGTVLNDGIDNWLRGLSIAYPIKVLDSGHNAILLLKKTE
ncbi:MAG: FecR family protein [Emcibacter sp.]|nr:FecR family protein [Emcibacter sp.]